MNNNVVSADAKPEPTAVPAEAKPTREQLLAKAKVVLQERAVLATHSHTNAAGVIQEYAKTRFGEQDLGSLIRGSRSVRTYGRPKERRHAAV